MEESKMISKRKVRDFISKVQTKAIQALAKEYKIKKNKVIVDFLNLPQNSRLKELIASYETAVYDILGIREEIVQDFGEVWLGSFNYGDTFNGIEHFFRYSSFNYTELKNIEVAHEEMSNKVRGEYTKLRNICDEMSAKKAVEYLKELNFDVSYFYKDDEVEEKSPLDTSIMFPCGNGKVD